MEYTQWALVEKENENFKVLILVVMEYTQWDRLGSNTIHKQGLNPCCNGIYSMSKRRRVVYKVNESLNPCCNGIYSMSEFFSWTVIYPRSVLILVVMEYTQWG